MSPQQPDPRGVDVTETGRLATELRIWLPVDVEHPAIEAIVDVAMSRVQDEFGLDAIVSSETKPESEWYVRTAASDAQSPQVLDRAGVQLLMEDYLAGRRSADEYYEAVRTLAAETVKQELADARDRRLRQA